MTGVSAVVGLKKERGFLNFVVVVRKKEKQKKKNSHTALCVVCCVYMCVCVCSFQSKKKKRSRAPLYKNSICLASLFFIVLMLCETFYVVYLFFLVLVV